MAPAPKLTLLFARLSALSTLLTVALGSVVCATKSGFDCHSWPGCYPDRFVPGTADIPAVLAANPALEMVHRVTAMGTGAVLVIAALLTLRLVGHGRLVKVLPWVAVAAAGGSALFGRAAVLGLGVDATGAAVDLLFALTAMALSALTALALTRGGRLALTDVSAPAGLAATLLVVMHVTGQLAAGNRSFTRCMSWPVLWLASDDNLLVQVLRTGFAIAAAVALVVAVRAGLRTAAVRGHALVVAGLLAGVLVLAVAYRASGTDGGVLGVTFSLASVALLWSTITLAGRARPR